ncbi:MAG: ubiquinone biosynthesis protein UbiB [Nitrospirae bacterium]|nr:ubiquinone biosynthesis protein UbiB [Nitrospirota bacterium]
MPIFRVRETYQDLKRYGHIVTVLVRYGFGDLLDRLKARYYVPWQRKVFKKEVRGLERLSTPERVRLAFEELGPTFIKFGQILSSRPDLLPAEFIQEFSKLQDRVPPFPFEDARALIEAQLGRPLNGLFEYIDEQPVAAASLAQVHRARTKAGDDVAVKVQRPAIEDIIETDIRILHDLATLAERHLPESRYYEPVRIVDEFARTIRRELDFVREGRNIERFRKYFAGDETVYIPKVYRDLTAPKVLTIEYIRGIKISDLEQLQAAGLDCKTIATNGANLILKEVFEFHFFHADPHPGNLFVLENNVIAPVDFGMIGMLDEEIAYQIGIMFTAIVEKDVDSMLDIFLSIGITPEPIDRTAFRLELADFLERYYEVPLQQLNIGIIINELMDIIRHYRLRFPPDLVMMTKALVINEGVGTMLYPEFNIIEHTRPYAQKLMIRRFDPTRQLKELSKLVGDAVILFKKLPSDMREILTKIKKDELGIKFEHRGLERITKELDRSSNRLSFAVVIAALIIGSSIVFQTEVGPKLFGYPLLGLAGFLLASILGLWLLIGILRSGRL